MGAGARAVHQQGRGEHAPHDGRDRGAARQPDAGLALFPAEPAGRGEAGHGGADLVKKRISYNSDLTAFLLTLLAVTFAGLWVLSPIDLIPEFLPVIGPLDDIVVFPNMTVTLTVAVVLSAVSWVTLTFCQRSSVGRDRLLPAAAR